MLEWLQTWYDGQCDGEWEHEYGIIIQTLDNPGWTVKIDLAFTPLEDLSIPYTVRKQSENDWVGYFVQEKIFRGNGDPSKLEAIISIFREIWESETA